MKLLESNVASPGSSGPTGLLSPSPRLASQLALSTAQPRLGPRATDSQRDFRCKKRAALKANKSERLYLIRDNNYADVCGVH